MFSTLVRVVIVRDFVCTCFGQDSDLVIKGERVFISEEVTNICRILKSLGFSVWQETTGADTWVT